MEFSRRTALAAIGATGAGAVGLGYWQRRRLRRLSTIGEFRDVVGIEVPRIEDDPIIAMPLLESAYDRAVDRFDETEPRLDPPLERYSEAFVDDLREQLTENAPDRVSIRPHGTPAMYFVRRQALLTYRRMRSRIVGILAYESPEELPAESIDERSAAVRDRVESLTIPYRGERLGEAIVAGTTIESAVGDAERRLERAGENDGIHVRWRELERATAAIEDAESYVQGRDGTDYGDDLPTIAERLLEEFERRRDEAPDSIVEDEDGEIVSSFTIGALTLLHRPMRHLGGYPYGRGGLLDGDRYGRAAFTYALLLPTVPLYEAFADVPHASFWEERDYRIGATAEELRAEKAAAIDAVEPYLDAEDPLVSHLAGVPLGALRVADSRLQELIDDPRGFDDDEWTRRGDLVLLKYESARRYAEAIEEAIEVVPGIEAPSSSS